MHRGLVEKLSSNHTHTWISGIFMAHAVYRDVVAPVLVALFHSTTLQLSRKVKGRGELKYIEGLFNCKNIP